eukprot:COSAG01_NODE_65960_length_271_cov_1.523256_1_plen_56_part_01
MGDGAAAAAGEAAPQVWPDPVIKMPGPTRIMYTCGDGGDDELASAAGAGTISQGEE